MQLVLLWEVAEWTKSWHLTEKGAGSLVVLSFEPLDFILTYNLDAVLVHKVCQVYGKEKLCSLDWWYSWKNLGLEVWYLEARKVLVSNCSSFDCNIVEELSISSKYSRVFKLAILLVLIENVSTMNHLLDRHEGMHDIRVLHAHNSVVLAQLRVIVKTVKPV